MRGRMPCLHVSDGSNMYPVQAGEGGARIGSLEVVCEGVQVNSPLQAPILAVLTGAELADSDQDMQRC